MVTIKNQAVKTGLGLSVLILFLTGCGPPGPTALLEGKQLLDSGLFQPALEKCRLATVLMPTNALAFNYLGLACHQAGQLAEAERAYARALSLNRDMAETRFNLGCLFLSQNKLEQAKSEFTAFTLRRPNSPEGFSKLGTAQLRAREFVAAERTFNDALRLDPNQAEALNGLGLAKLQRNRAAEAVRFFNKALQVQPDYRPALLNLAVVSQENLRDRQTALRAYKRLLALKPPVENAAALETIVRNLEQPTAVAAEPIAVPTNTLAQSRPSASDPDQTRKAPAVSVQAAKSAGPTGPPERIATQQLASLPPPPTNTARGLASAEPPKVVPKADQAKAPVALVQGPLEQVTLATEPALKTGQDPALATSATAKRDLFPASSDSTAHTNKVAKHGLFQKINPARLFSSEERDSRPAPANSIAEAVPSPTNQADAATSSFPRYPYRNPSKPQSGNHSQAERSYSQGLQAHQAHRLPEAMQAYRRAIQLDPAFFNAYFNLAVAATESGNLETALTTYETALALRPEFQEARYNFALLLKQSNYPLDSENELKKILINFPNDSRAHLALGNLYSQQLGKTALARQHYLKVLELDARNPQSPKIQYWLAEHPK